jgi:hypothetical protein
VSDHELEPEALPVSASIEPPGPDVLLRTLVPPYRLGEVLLRIAELKLTGRLSLSSDMGKRTVYFHSGFPVFSESSLFGERLGAIGVRHGLLGRDDVARGLTYARERSCGLGQALLETECIDGAGLFALLGLQLREVVAASCGGEPLRARFQGGRAALDGVVILRLHPLTAVLAAVAAMPSADQDRLLQAVATRRVLPAPIPAVARQWLADLGYLGELDRLTLGDPTASGMRSRLLARQRPGAEKCFDPESVPFCLPGARAEGPRPNAAKAADLATLTLLMTGALKLAEPAARDAGRRASEPAQPNVDDASALQLSLEGAAGHPLAEIRSASNGLADTEVDRMLEAYLLADRGRTLAGAAAVWGPSVEAGDASVPAELMRLYLTLKPEKRAHVVLGAVASASAEQIMQAYARRAALLASIDRPNAGPHLHCRAAELARAFDDALEKLVPGAVPISSSRPPQAGAGTSDHAASAQELSASMPSPPLGQRPAAEALPAKIEALMRAGNWRAVLDTLEGGHGPDPTLPFTLKLAHAMAQRELLGRPRAARRTLVLAFLLGVAAGVALQHFAGSSALLERPWLRALWPP